MQVLPDTNKSYFIQSRDSAKVLDVNRANKAAGEKVIQWECHGGANQQWFFESVGDEQHSYYVRNKNSNLYLQFDGSGRLIQANKSNSNNQKFNFTSSLNGGVRITSRSPYKAIDVPGFSKENGAWCQAWDPTGKLNQSFYLCSEIPKKLQLLKVNCQQPAAGIPTMINNVIGGIATGSGAVVGVIGVGTAVAGVTTGGVAIAVVGAGIGIVGLASLTATIVDSFASGEDDLYIEVNSNKIWPSGSAHGYIDQGDTKELNLTLSSNWQASNTIQLWEHDTLSSDDTLTPKLQINPMKSMWNSEFTVLTGDDSEGSVYALTFLLT